MSVAMDVVIPDAKEDVPRNARSMNSGVEVLSLELSLHEDQITGLVRLVSEPPRPFTGYLELIELLEARRAAARDATATDTLS